MLAAAFIFLVQMPLKWIGCGGRGVCKACATPVLVTGDSHICSAHSQVSPLALGSGLSRAWASIYSASVTRPRRGGDRRPRRRGAGLHTGVEEAGPADGPKNYDRGPGGSTLSDPQPPPAPFPPPPTPAKVLYWCAPLFCLSRRPVTVSEIA